MKTRITRILALIISITCVFSCFAGCAAKASMFNGMTIAEQTRYEEQAFSEDEAHIKGMFERYYDKKEIDGTIYYLKESEATFSRSDYSSSEELSSAVKKHFLEYMDYRAFSQIDINEDEKTITMKVNKEVYNPFDKNGLYHFQEAFFLSSKNKYMITITAQRKFSETSFGEISEDRKSVTIVFTSDKEAAPDEIVIKYQ